MNSRSTVNTPSPRFDILKGNEEETLILNQVKVGYTTLPTGESILLRSPNEEVQLWDRFLAEQGNMLRPVSTVVEGGNSLPTPPTNGGPVPETLTDMEKSQFDENIVSEYSQKTNTEMNKISQSTIQIFSKQVPETSNLEERKFEDNLIIESTNTSSLGQGNTESTEYYSVLSPQANNNTLKCSTDANNLPILKSVDISPQVLWISVPSSRNLEISQSIGDQSESKDLNHESEVTIKNTKGGKRKKTEEEKKEDNRLKAIANRKKKKIESDKKDETIKNLEDKYKTLKNEFSKQIILKDKEIADLKKQLEVSAEMKTVLDFSPANLSLSRDVPCSVLNNPVSNTQFDVEKIDKKMRQAEIASMDPDNFLDFMNDWLTRKGMTIIEMNRQEAGALVTLHEHEKSIKIKIIKRYREIKHEKDRSEKVREDLVSNGLVRT